jgi:hypothetical protein
VAGSVPPAPSWARQRWGDPDEPTPAGMVTTMLLLARRVGGPAAAGDDHRAPRVAKIANRQQHATMSHRARRDHSDGWWRVEVAWPSGGDVKLEVYPALRAVLSCAWKARPSCLHGVAPSWLARRVGLSPSGCGRFRQPWRLRRPAVYPLSSVAPVSRVGRP